MGSEMCIRDRGWTVEAEVYESLMTSNINEKYLPGHEIPTLDSTMELSDITDTCEILILALPSGVILSVVNDLIPHLRPSHVLIDLAKGLAPTSESESGMISREIEDRLAAAGKSNPVVVLTGPTIAPEVACLLYTSPSPRDLSTSRMPSSA